MTGINIKKQHQQTKSNKTINTKKYMSTFNKEQQPMSRLRTMQPEN
jgi:hypothetical protein